MKPHLAAAGILALVILAPALLSFGSFSASGLSPQADAPPGLVPLAFQAGANRILDDAHRVEEGRTALNRRSFSNAGCAVPRPRRGH